MTDNVDFTLCSDRLSGKSSSALEHFRIAISNLPKHMSIPVIKKMLQNRLKLNPRKIKSQGEQISIVYVTFGTQEERDEALTKVEGFTFKGSQLRAKIAEEIGDTFGRKRQKLENVDNGVEEEAKDIRDIIIPWWNMSYEEQLKKKRENMVNLLRKMGSQMIGANRELKQFVADNRSRFSDDTPCEFLPIRESPQREGYRNKNEFTVGLDRESGEPTVGFRFATYEKGCVSVASVTPEMIHVPESARRVANAFEIFIRRRKDVRPPHDPTTHSGFWRQLTVRTGMLDATQAPPHVMAVVVLHPQGLTDSELRDEQELVRKFFAEDEIGKAAGVTSLWWQHYAKLVANQEPTLVHLDGTKTIEETLLGLKFEIAPLAFFQVNSAGAEVLYEAIREFVAPDSETTVLDLFCGTGTIGLCVAKSCKRVLGCELVKEAVENANKNAQTNGITNAGFLAGKAEDILEYTLSLVSKEKKLVAVVDPPRPGLHPSTIKMLRNAHKIQRIVYAACNPTAAVENIVNLCRAESRAFHGAPFVPTKAVAVDMFPHTPHCEVVFCLERFNNLSAASNQVSATPKTECDPAT